MFFSLLMILVGSAAFSAEPALDSLWQESVGLYQSEKYAESCQKFESWKIEAQARSIDSKDLYANLSLCYAKQSRWDHSVWNLLALTQREASPTAKWADLTQVQRIQEHLGLQDNPIKDFSVQLKLLFSTQYLLLAFSIAVWLLTFPAVQLLVFKKRWNGLHWSVIGIGATILLFSGALLANRKLVGKIAVLTSEENEISVYEKAVEESEQRLVQLPRGAVVVSGRSANGLVQIQSPLVGWVKSELLQPLN